MTTAIRVAKRGNRQGHTWHYLLDDGRTLCGRHVDTFEIVERDERDTLPAVEACRGCLRFVDGWTPQHEGRIDAKRGATLPPSMGRLRTTGSLNHGTRTRSAWRLR